MKRYKQAVICHRGEKKLMPTCLLSLQIRLLLEKWLAIWPHILTEWLTANCDHGQWWETDRGKRLWKILSWGMAELDNIKPEEEVTRWRNMIISIYLKDCLETFHSTNFLSICYVPGTMPEVKDAERKNQNWSLIFSSFLASGRNVTIARESRTMVQGKQVEGQRHRTRKPFWPEGSSFAKEWTCRSGWAEWVREGMTTTQEEPRKLPGQC